MLHPINEYDVSKEGGTLLVTSLGPPMARPLDVSGRSGLPAAPGSIGFAEARLVRSWGSGPGTAAPAGTHWVSVRVGPGGHSITPVMEWAGWTGPGVPDRPGVLVDASCIEAHRAEVVGASPCLSQIERDLGRVAPFRLEALAAATAGMDPDGIPARPPVGEGVDLHSGPIPGRAVRELAARERPPASDGSDVLYLTPQGWAWHSWCATPDAELAARQLRDEAALRALGWDARVLRPGRDATCALVVDLPGGHRAELKSEWAREGDPGAPVGGGYVWRYGWGPAGAPMFRPGPMCRGSRVLNVGGVAAEVVAA